MAKPGNALGVSVLNTVQAAAADVSFAAGEITITGLPPFRYKDVVGYVSTAAAVGTLQIDTITFTAFTPVIGQAYKIKLRPNLIRIGVAEIPIGQTEVYITVATTVTANDLSQQFADAITNNTQSKVTAVNAAGVITVTQKDFTIDGFSVPEVPGLVVVATTTPFVKPAGSQTEVEGAVDSSVSVDATTFQKYEIELHRRKEFDSAGDVSAQRLLAIVYVDDTDGNFAALDTELDAVFDGTHTPATDYDAVS